MIWGILIVIMLVLVVSMVAYIYRKDRLYLKKTARDAMSEDVRKDIDAEIEDAKRRQQKFKASLESAAKLSKSQDNSLTSE